MSIKLGDKIRDKVSGFEGLCVGITTCLHGCNRLTIQPQGLHEGKPVDAFCFDEPQCELVEAKSYVVPKSDKPGGPPARAAHIKR